MSMLWFSETSGNAFPRQRRQQWGAKVAAGKTLPMIPSLVPRDALHVWKSFCRIQNPDTPRAGEARRAAAGQGGAIGAPRKDDLSCSTSRQKEPRALDVSSEARIQKLLTCRVHLSIPKPGHTTGGSGRRSAQWMVGRGEAGQTKVPTFRSASKQPSLYPSRVP